MHLCLRPHYPGPNLKTMRCYHYAITLTILCTAQHAQSQVRTLNWNTSFSPAWADGATSGTATNIGGSGVNANVDISKVGGTWRTSLLTAGGAQTPTKNGSYTVGTMSAPNNLMLALDFNSVNDYAEVNITFSSAIYNVSFSIGDIDRYFRNRNDFMDEVVVQANAGTAHPTFGRFTTDPNFPNQLQFSGDTVRVNSNGNLSGNAGPAGYPTIFDALEQAGTATVSFGTAPINTLRISYRSAAGTISNPSVQAIAISNISFMRLVVLPVQLLSFTSVAKTKGNNLEWTAEHEDGLNYYTVERSIDASRFVQLANVTAQRVAGTASYNYHDVAATAQKNFYRIKMVHMDGTVHYSPVIAISKAQAEFTINKFYNTGKTKSVMAELTVPTADQATLSLYSATGLLYCQQVYSVAAGVNMVSLKNNVQLPAGLYVLSVQYKHQRKSIKAML